MKYNNDLFLASLDSWDWEERRRYYRSWREENIEKITAQLSGLEFSNDQEKTLILEYMKGIAKGAQIERDFTPQFNRETEEKEVPSSTWSAGMTFYRLCSYRSGRDLSAKSLNAHRSFIQNVAAEFVSPEDITWEYNRETGIKRGYKMSSFGPLALALNVWERTDQLFHQTKRLESVEQDVLQQRSVVKSAEVELSEARIQLSDSTSSVVHTL